METHLSGKIGAKKLRKLEEKQARKAQREASRRDGGAVLRGGKGPCLPCLLCSRPSPRAGWVFDACLTPSPATVVFGLSWPVWEVSRLWLEVEMCQL